MVWVALVLSIGLFSGLHLLPFAPGARGRLTDRLGERGYAIAFALLSLAGLLGAFALAGRAPVVPLWHAGEALRWLALLLTLVGFVLLAAAYLGGEGWRLARHPMLSGIVLWAGGHVLVVGDLAHVLLFASLALYGVAAMMLSDRRSAARDPEAAALHFARTRPLPFAGLVGGKGLGGFRSRAVAAGVVAWLVFLLLHRMLFGVSPFPLALPG